MDLPEPTALPVPGDLEPDAAPGAGRRRRQGRSPDLPAGRRARPGQDRAGAAGRRGGERLSALVVVPNVVKTNWAREAGLDPKHPSPIHGDGHTIDGFADIVVVNYEVLDRHVGWLGDFGFRGMVVDEAHFIKNKSTAALAARARALRAHPRPHRASAPDGADRHPADQRHRGLPGDLAVPRLDRRQEAARRAMDALEDTGLTPADFGFYRRRNSVVDLGIVRRRKVDVAKDIPARRVADLPVGCSTTRSAVRSGRRSGRAARRMVERYETALERRTSGLVVDGIDHEPYAGLRPGSARTPPRRRRTRTCSA